MTDIEYTNLPVEATVGGDTAICPRCGANIVGTVTGPEQDEVERLRERCEAYKGQVWMGSKEIEGLRADSARHEKNSLLQMERAIRAEAEVKRLREDAARYRYLRNRPEDTIGKGGIFAGMTPKNVILTEDDLDRAVDRAMADEQIANPTDNSRGG